MRADEAVVFLNAGLKRDKLALTQRGRLQKKLAEQLETDPKIIEILAFAIQVFEREDVAYLWLSQPIPLLHGKTPLEEMVDGDRAHVRQLLANLAYGLSA